MRHLFSLFGSTSCASSARDGALVAERLSEQIALHDVAAEVAHALEILGRLQHWRGWPSNWLGIEAHRSDAVTVPVSLIVIDDFLTDPHAFRERALQLTYTRGGPYPGHNSVEYIQLDGLEQEISRLVHEPLRAPNPLESHGKCRLALAKDDTPGKIHVDPSHWSGILYLTKPEDCRGGTEFYRHIPTGTDGAPTELEGLRAMGYSSYSEMRADVLERDALDRSKWELTNTIPMRFNRLILLRPWLWHTSGPGFGDTVANGRLIYVMFFKRAFG